MNITARCHTDCDSIIREIFTPEKLILTKNHRGETHARLQSKICSDREVEIVEKFQYCVLKAEDDVMESIRISRGNKPLTPNDILGNSALRRFLIEVTETKPEDESKILKEEKIRVEYTRLTNMSDMITISILDVDIEKNMTVLLKVANLLSRYSISK